MTSPVAPRLPVTDAPPRACPLAVVGTLALDDVRTPAGEAHDVLGGSAVYFAVASSVFARTAVVGVVGEDYPARARDLLATRDADLSGIVTAPGSTFRWSGRYDGSMNAATTIATRLNVLAGFAPELDPVARRAPVVFLANNAPAIQLRVLSQLESPRLVVADTMNLWIDTERETLLRVLSKVDGLFVNDGEARLLSGEGNLVAAGRRLLTLGPRFAVVKKGEHGAFLFARDRSFALPAYPIERVVDPTGAGDSFAGGCLGRLAAHGGTGTLDVARAMVYGTVLASYAVSSFGPDALAAVTAAEIEARAEELRRFVSL